MTEIPLNYIKTKRKLIICMLFLIILYSFYITLDSKWFISKSVSNLKIEAKNVVNLAKIHNSYLLPNLMHPQFVVNESHIKNINAEKLSSLLKSPSIQVLFDTIRANSP